MLRFPAWYSRTRLAHFSTAILGFLGSTNYGYVPGNGLSIVTFFFQKKITRSVVCIADEHGLSSYLMMRSIANPGALEAHLINFSESSI
jgi:hypothetical protein